MDSLKIIQHNVNKWERETFSLSTIYRSLDPDIILINDLSLLNSIPLKIYNYITHTSNKDNFLHRGTVIAVKYTIKHQIVDDFETDLLAVKIKTSLGPVTITSEYIPPSRTYFNMPDYAKLLNTPQPDYILGDLNARHPVLGHSDTNIAGDFLKMCKKNSIT